MNYYYLIRYNDGVINTHEAVINQVKLMQTKLKEAHCFNDLKIDGRYGDETLKAVYLMKRRIHNPLNDICDRHLWTYLMDVDLPDVAIVGKPNSLEVPKELIEILGLPKNRIEPIISNLIAIPCFNQFTENQIIALTLFSHRTGYVYGNEQFKALNTMLKMKALIRIPEVLKLYITQRNREQRLQEISFWNLD